MPSESEFLNLQIESAKAHFRQTARSLGEELLEPLQLRPLIRRRPWWSLGGAAVVGFVAGLRSGRRAPKSGALPTGGTISHISHISHIVATVNQRVRRVLGSALGAMVVANLRGAAPAASPREQHDTEPSQPV